MGLVLCRDFQLPKCKQNKPLLLIRPPKHKELMTRTLNKPIESTSVSFDGKLAWQREWWWPAVDNSFLSAFENSNMKKDICCKHGPLPLTICD